MTRTYAKENMTKETTKMNKKELLKLLKNKIAIDKKELKEQNENNFDDNKPSELEGRIEAFEELINDLY